MKRPKTELSSIAKKARERLRRYERLLRKEKADYGCYTDGAGKRYDLGPLYMVLGDVPGALASFAWFDREFPDDSGELWTFLAWSLALHRTGREDEAVRRLKQAMLTRPTIFARLFGEAWTEVSIDSAQDPMEGSPAELIAADFMVAWTDDDRSWAVGLYRSPELTKLRERLVDIERQLAHAPRGERRTELVSELFGLKRG